MSLHMQFFQNGINVNINEIASMHNSGDSLNNLIIHPINYWRILSIMIGHMRWLYKPDKVLIGMTLCIISHVHVLKLLT